MAQNPYLMTVIFSTEAQDDNGCYTGKRLFEKQIEFDLTVYQTEVALKAAVDAITHKLANEYNTAKVRISKEVLGLPFRPELYTGTGGIDWYEVAIRLKNYHQTPPPSDCAFKLGDKVIYTNSYGVEFPRTVMGFDPADGEIYLDNSSWWVSVKEHELRLAA